MGDVHERERIDAMVRGQDQWARWGSASHHKRYAAPARPTSRSRCDCGCGKRATHIGCANGLALMGGCELTVRRWVRDGCQPSPPSSSVDEGNTDV